MKFSLKEKTDERANGESATQVSLRKKNSAF